MIKEKDKIQIICKAGGSIVSLPPIFSHDAKHLYVAKSYNIVSYNVLTGNKVMELSSVSNEIIGFGVGLINNGEHIIACTKNGRIILWKSNSGLKLREIKTGLNHVTFFKTFTTFDDDNNPIAKAVICCENKIKKRYEVRILNLITETSEIVKKIQLKLKRGVHLDIADDGRFIAIVQGNALNFYRFDTDVLRRHLMRDRIFTYVLCHPTEDVVLTGDNTGRAVIWENLQYKSPTQAIYHWHTLPVKSAAFSRSGTMFYSGGSECVLVKWILNDNHKTFLPRLPGFIEHISVAPDNLYIALSTSDNGIQIVTPQLKIKSSIQHLVVGDSITTELTYDSRSKSLVFNGISGQVQFFSPRDLNLVYSLDVSGQNKCTDERETLIINSSITHVAIDKTGLWMATVEERTDPDMLESRLRFWFYDIKNQSFVLNTSIEYPHEGTIAKLLFQPSSNENELCCVTVGTDKKFKIWQAIPIKTVYRDGLVWECSNDVSYRNLCPNVCSFSADGSLLAMGFESIATAWLPSTCELKCSLRHPIQEDVLCHVSFGTDNQCHLLLSATKKFISVWNLLSLSIVWITHIDVQYIVADINTSYKTVFTTDKKLYVFEPNSPNPVDKLKKLRNIPDIKSAVFVPRKTIASDVNTNWAQRLSIYVLTSSFELFAIESSNTEITESSLHIKEDQSFFKNMLPEIRNALFKDQSEVHRYTKDIRGKKFLQLLDTPVPSLQLPFLCEDILADSLVQKGSTLSTVDTAVKEDKKLNNSVRNKLFDKDLSLESVSLEKMRWTSILLSK